MTNDTWRHLSARFLLGLALVLGSTGGRAAEPSAEWIPLFDGRTLTGWRAAENPGSFRVEDGAIECDGPRAHLCYERAAGAPFTSFELGAEMRTRPGATSAVFCHTAVQEREWPAQGV